MSATEGRRTIYRKTTLGILYNFGGKNIGFILTFIFTIIIARHLGPSDYGSYSFYRNTAAFLALFTILGLDQTMNHFVPALRQSGDDGKIRQLLRKGFGLSISGIGCVSLFTIIVFCIIPQQTDWGFEFSPGILLLFLGLIIGITFSVIMKGVVSGMFHQRFLNIIETGSVVSKLLLTLIFFQIGLDVEGVLLAVVIAFTFPSLLYYRHAMKELGVIDVAGGKSNQGRHGDSSDRIEGGRVDEKGSGRGEGPDDGYSGAEGIQTKWLEMRKYALIMIIFTASYIMLDNQIDIIMLKFISDDSEAGYYNIAFRFAFINAMVFIGAIDGVLVPTFTSLKTEDDLHQRKALSGALKYTLFFLIPVAVAGFMFTDQLVEVFFGEDYSDSVIMLRVFYGTLVLSMALSWPIRFLMVSIGWEGKILRIYVGYAILNVVGNLILIPRYDGIGAVVATGCTAMLMALHLLMEVRKTGLLEFPSLFTVKSIAAAFISVAPCYFVLSWITDLPSLAAIYVVFYCSYLALNYLMKGITKEELVMLWDTVVGHGDSGGTR